ncbi:hypothetical protein EMPS_00126 [Entomortierella parvispora]|uniref:Uncharacterized protein n=1 Tax=Entomortierella parvispora TaxID=205924 RepID=A0A9P3LRP5_9FUNG|nr:hypothetical protein EMPS_00126 [Entomortierella parvispora]
MPYLSAHDALKQAKASTDKARNARGTGLAVIDHYRDAKKALGQVDVTKADRSTLEEMITAFDDLAEVLDSSGEHTQGKAVKCRQKADALRQKLNKRMKLFAAIIAPSLIGPGISPAMAQGGFNHWNSSASTSNTASTPTYFVASTAAPVSAVGSSRQPPPPFSRPSISVSAASTTLGYPSFFSHNANPEPSACPLPSPGEPLQTVRQLAYSLALLETSIQERDLFPEALEWRLNTLNNSDEKDRLETMAVHVLEKFAKDTRKDAAAVAEVVQLAPVLNDGYSRFLIKTFIDTVNKSEILDLHSLDGLAKVIQGAPPGSIDSNDLVTILRCLHKRPRPTHSEGHQYHLLLAASRVLDAMMISHIGDVDRIDLHEPLTDFLRELESSKDPYLAFQAKYATQALLYVSDDEDIWHAGFRRLWLVLGVGAGLAQVNNLQGLNDTLDSVERLYDCGKGATRKLKFALEAIKDRERPTFTLKEGLKFKRAWYRAVRMAEWFIATGNLVEFKILVIKSKCRHQLMFQWGICQLLGQFIADSQWSVDAHQDAIAFLGALHKDATLWDRQKEVDQVILDVLTIVASKNDAHFEAAETILKELRRQNTQLKPFANLHSPIWISIKFESSNSHSTSKDRLLKAVQDQYRRHDLPQLPSLSNIYTALETYHAPDLSILRVSGDELDLQTCFVNLAIVEAPKHRQNEKEDLQKQATTFYRMISSETVHNTDTQSLIPLEQLFNKRRLPSEDSRVAAWKNCSSRKSLLLRIWIKNRRLWPKLLHFALKKERFFSSYGLDEIGMDAGGDESDTFRPFLKMLLGQQHVIITSRPSGMDRKLLPAIDLELETVGFSQQNVKDFVAKVLDPEAAKTVQEFIQRTPLIQGLVNIPVQLDVICFSWEELPLNSQAVTMIGLYQLMVRKLWCKDAFRLRKTAGGMQLTKQQIHGYVAEEIDELMATELQYLGYLAFKGMNNNHQIEFEDRDLRCAFRDLRSPAADHQQLSPPQLVDAMKKTSFLHTADSDLDSRRGSRPQQAWHFLHLTFQEYFAATWIFRHFQPRQPCFTAGMKTKEEMADFLHWHKYDPRFEIVWSMVAGLLEGKPLCDFFGLLQEEPCDLIGGRHQQILASCLNESRAHLDSTVLSALESELLKWLHLEIRMRRRHIDVELHEDVVRSMHLGRIRNSERICGSALGSRLSFPEALLVKAMGSRNSSETFLIDTLGSRSILSQSAIQSLIIALKDDNGKVGHLSALALGKQSSLPESAVQSLIETLSDDYDDVRISAVWALGEQSSLPESAIQALITTLKDDHRRVRYSAASALGNQTSLPESAIKSLIATLSGDGKTLTTEISRILGSHSSSLFSLLPTLSQDEMACLFDNHLFLYSCNNVMSLQAFDNGLRLYTERGVHVIPKSSSKQHITIESVFKAAQQKALDSTDPS